MAFNAEKQARYRERHLGNGTKTWGHFFLEATTKAKLLRLAHHRNCSVPALIGDLAASAERQVTAQLSGKTLKRYYGEEQLPQLTSAQLPVTITTAAPR